MRRDHDPFYQEIYVKERITPEMRFLEKSKIFAEIEKEIDPIRELGPEMVPEAILEKYGVHHILNCPDVAVAQEMTDACNKVTATGDSSGGVIEVMVLGDGAAGARKKAAEVLLRAQQACGLKAP